jgi:hypothetical protein
LLAHLREFLGCILFCFVFSFVFLFVFVFILFLKGTTGFGTNPGGLFGQQNQQTTSLFSKPFGQATTTPNTGFSFGNTSTLGQPSTNTMVRNRPLVNSRSYL